MKKYEDTESMRTFCCGCGTVGRAVTSDVRGSNQLIGHFYLLSTLLKIWKRPEIAHSSKYTYI